MDQFSFMESLNFFGSNLGLWPGLGLYQVLYCTVMYCTVMYCNVFYCTVLYWTVLYFTRCWSVSWGLSSLRSSSISSINSYHVIQTIIDNYLINLGCIKFSIVSSVLILEKMSFSGGENYNLTLYTTIIKPYNLFFIV